MEHLEELKRKLEAAGYPVAYRAFPENDAPGLPFICYISRGRDSLYADGVEYYGYEDVAVELYTLRRDFGAEKAVEAALADYRWQKSQEYIDTEGCYVTIYETEV